MSQPNQSLVQAATRIDELVKKVGGAAALKAETFSEALTVAEAVGEMRMALTDEIMKPIMSLMNTGLGFLTDRDPARPKKDGSPTVPYSVAVVKECFIESRLRGFNPIGNEWNIISGKFYGCKNGFVRKVRNYPGISNFRDYYEVPKRAGDGAVVKCKASWKLNGKDDSVEREFFVKADSFATSDSIVGKATRKLLAVVYAIISGEDVPEGETEGSIPVESEVVKPREPAVSKKAEPATPAQAATEAELKPGKAV